MEVPDYSGEIEESDPNAIRRLGVLVAEMAQLVLKEEELEEQLKACKRELKNYQENLVPELMSKIGLDKLTTVGGIHVEMKEEVRASFPKDPDKRERALAWLHETGNAGIIKTEIVANFGRGTEEHVASLMNMIRQAGFHKIAAVTQDQTVHHSTLVKFIKDQLREGTPVPLEAFSAIQQRFARIKRG